jgi:hypothetical protein
VEYYVLFVKKNSTSDILLLPQHFMFHIYYVRNIVTYRRMWNDATEVYARMHALLHTNMQLCSNSL